MANKNLFKHVENTKLPRNNFDLTHDVKFTCKMGELIPVCAFDTVPGDRFNLSCETLVRFAPMVAPVMHRFDIFTHYFFVPNRLVWPEWEKYITDPNSGLAHPFITLNTSVGPGSDQERLLDYFGIPPKSSVETPVDTRKVNAIPFACYQKIYNEYYRDQNLSTEVQDHVVTGSNGVANVATIRRRAWEHDYFTSALPWAQKGAEVSIPIGDVTLKQNPDGTMRQIVRDTQLNAEPSVSAFRSDTGGELQDQGTTKLLLDPNGSLEVAPTTIQTLRRAFRLQEFLEKAARGGTRYIEYIRNIFGVRTSDARLQRPQYIYGSKTPVVITETLSTYGTSTSEAPQGNMAGHAIAVGNSRAGSFYAEEHGWIIGIMSIIPKTAYQQGIERKFLKVNDVFDYYIPQFAHIGEQEVLNEEVYAFQANGDETFGYVPRYSEYKFVQNRVAGDFRGNLDFWHAGRIFAAPPALNQAFIECTPDDRIFAVTDTTVDKIYVQHLNKVQAQRPMPYFGSPEM